MKIFDCITYLNEDHLLNLRFNILNEYVDYFVICESKEDHRGKEKKLNFNYEKFSRFKEKIIYLVVEKFENCKRTWDRQNYQRDYLINGISNANNDDFIEQIENLSSDDELGELPDDIVEQMIKQDSIEASIDGDLISALSEFSTIITSLVLPIYERHFSSFVIDL